MSEDDQAPVSTRWPLWSTPATKGDVIRAAVFSRAVTIKLGAMIGAVMQGDNEDAKAMWEEYLAEHDELMTILDSIGGA